MANDPLPYSGLGHAGAVFTRGWERTVELTGDAAKVVKRRINTEVIYPPADATREQLLTLSSLDTALQRRRAAVPAISDNGAAAAASAQPTASDAQTCLRSGRVL